MKLKELVSKLNELQEAFDDYEVMLGLISGFEHIDSIIVDTDHKQIEINPA